MAMIMMIEKKNMMMIIMIMWIMICMSSHYFSLFITIMIQAHQLLEQQENTLGRQ